MNKKVLFLAVTAAIITSGVLVFGSFSNENSSTNSEASSSVVESAPQVSQAYLEGANLKDSLDATGQEQVTVAVGDFFYQPAVLKVSKGATVVWKNQGDIRHTVTSAEDSPKQGLDSGLLNPGETYQYSFSETGIYNYFCQPHPVSMRAVVEVVE